MRHSTLPLAIVLILGATTAWATGGVSRAVPAVAGGHAGVEAAANGEDGGNGLPNGMPGCGGGTDPSPDGRFYSPGTKKPCNPGKQDRKKSKKG